MPYQVLYRTYRPQKFSEVVGQDYIVKTLCNAIKNNKIAHAYLFAGPRGTGKTTIAKLFAKAINCDDFNNEACDKCKSCEAYKEGNHPDIIELDAASNNGIDDIREIIEQVPYAPLIGKYKVYIIDEVHMLTAQAFNALLKTLEEPPAHVVFILATTDPQKVIPTVLSRCQRYNFSKINSFNISKKLQEILKQENINFNEKAVDQISRMAEGGMRDALSILEQCLAYNPNELSINDVEKIFGLTSTTDEVELYLNIHNNEIKDTISSVRKMYASGTDTKKLAIDLLEIIKDALIYSDKADTSLLSKLTPTEAQKILNIISINNLLNDAKNLEDIISKEKQNQNFLTYFELCLIQMANIKEEVVEEKEVKKAKPVTKNVEKEIKEEIVEIKEEPTKNDNDFLLSVLLDASKDLKINNQIIYNKLDLYQYEPEKRKYYQLLIGTELFACNKDAIIICGSKTQTDNINIPSINEDLYNFLVTEFGIDKMVYAINEEEKKNLIEAYKKAPVEKRNKPVFVKKYEIKKVAEQSTEDKLKEMFGDSFKIED